MSREKKNRPDNAGSNDESMNEQLEHSTCNNFQMFMNTVAMSSGLIGNVSQLSLDGNLCQN